EAEADDDGVVGQSKGKARGTHPHEHRSADPSSIVVVAEVGTTGAWSGIQPPFTTGSASGLPSQTPESLTQSVAPHELPSGKTIQGEEDRSTEDGGRLAPVALDQTPEHRGRTPGVRGVDAEEARVAEPVGVGGELVVPETKPEMPVKYSAERVDEGLCSASAGSQDLGTISKRLASEPGTTSGDGLGGGEMVDTMEVLDLTAAAATAPEQSTPASEGASPCTQGVVDHAGREKAVSEVRNKRDGHQHTSADVGKDALGAGVASFMPNRLGGAADEVPETMPPMSEGAAEN
ncbi:unnamed protein product, partial [Laminaria digitata]